MGRKVGGRTSGASAMATIQVVVLLMVVATVMVTLASAAANGRPPQQQRIDITEQFEKKAGRCAQDNPRPKPFRPKKKLAFCTEYQDRSCCDRKLTKSIKNATFSLVDPACANCHAMVAEYKCAECSPDSSMFHEGEKSQIRFCWDYCVALFSTCSDIALSPGNDPFYLNEGGLTAEEWCADKTDEEPFCFRGFIPAEKDSNCLCPSHDCHLPPQPTHHDDL